MFNSDLNIKEVCQRTDKLSAEDAPLVLPLSRVGPALYDVRLESVLGTYMTGNRYSVSYVVYRQNVSCVSE